METITIVTSGQRSLREGRMVGGAPVVARRQALALASHGWHVRLIDLVSKETEEPWLAERWQWDDQSAVEVDTWELYTDSINPLGRRSVASSEAVLSAYSPLPGSLFVQEALLGSVAKAARNLRIQAIWQPNDYSFVCARSWLLTGGGQRCTMEASREVCGNCQIQGRNLVETTFIRGCYLANRWGYSATPVNIGRLVAAAHSRGGNARYFVGCFDWFIAQSEPMLDVLIKYGAPRGQILRLDYGVEPPKRRLKEAREAKSKMTFAFIARPTFEKGLHLVLEAWADLDAEQLSKARLLVYSPIGAASSFQRRRLRAAFARCTNVEVRNESVSSRLDEVYKEIDVAVQPSLWVDHNTQTILEALARGVPVIVPGHTSFGYGIVRDGENGVLIDVDDKSSLRNAISKCISDSSLFSKIQSAEPYSFTDSDWAAVVLPWLEKLRASGHKRTVSV